MSLAWFLPLPGSYAGVDVVGVYNFACSLREVLAKHPFLPHGCGLFSGSYFPSISEGLSLRGFSKKLNTPGLIYFPSFSEGLSLRGGSGQGHEQTPHGFPFLFGGTFIEGKTHQSPGTHSSEDFPSFSEGLSLRGRLSAGCVKMGSSTFPFLFGGTFIEGDRRDTDDAGALDFPSFSEGLSLRGEQD